MGKLKALSPRLAALPPRLGHAPGDRKANDRARDASAPWRRWYDTARWKKLRQQVFVRDGFVCQRSGELCSGAANTPNAPIANHKVPHRGNPALFWDIDNIETVTKRVHDTIIQSEEQAVPRGNWD
jgi:hypothetical protein